MNMTNTVQRLRIGGYQSSRETIYYKALLLVLLGIGGFLLAGTGGGNLGWVDVPPPPNEREGLPEEREGVLEEIEGALEGVGGVLMVVPRCSPLDLGAVGGGAARTTSFVLNFVSLSSTSAD